MLHLVSRALNLRLDRRYFWIGLGLIAAVTALLAKRFPSVLNGGFGLPFVLLHGARLHDFGRSGMWAFAPITAFLLLLTGLAILSAPSIVNGGVAITAFLGLAAFTLWVGAKRGDLGGNRFGPGRAA